MAMPLPQYPAAPFVLFRGLEAPRVRLICFHHAAGSAGSFRAWAEIAPEDIEIIGVQLPGRENRRHVPFATSVEEVASEVVEALEMLDHTPWVAFGHSLGGVLAYECVRRMRARPHPGRGLALAAARPPHTVEPPRKTGGQSDEALLQRVRSFAGTPQALLDNPEALQFFLPRIRADFQMSESYWAEQAEPLDVPILLIRALDDAVVEAGLAGRWSEYALGSFECHDRLGGHFFPQANPNDTANLVFSWARRCISG